MKLGIHAYPTARGGQTDTGNLSVKCCIYIKHNKYIITPMHFFLVYIQRLCIQQTIPSYAYPSLRKMKLDGRTSMANVPLYKKANGLITSDEHPVDKSGKIGKQ